MQTAEQENAGELSLEQLQVIETGWGPTVESAVLVDLLKRSPRLDESLTDPTEIANEDNPLARMNAYKHRVHSLRCAYADARLRGIELEEQLVEARSQIHQLKATLEQIYATRWWKARERCARCWRAVLGWLRNPTVQTRTQRSI